MASIFVHSGGAIRFRSLTYKRVFTAWSYGASPVGLAKRYGWRVVREVINSTLRQPTPKPLVNSANIVHGFDSKFVDWRGKVYA